jgi:hypothetical protein
MAKTNQAKADQSWRGRQLARSQAVQAGRIPSGSLASVVDPSQDRVLLSHRTGRRLPA